jgi:hypothetical protein
MVFHLRQPEYGTVLLLIAVAYGLCATQATAKSNSITLLLQLVTVGIIFHAAGVGRILRTITYVVLLVAATLVTIASFIHVQGKELDIALSAAAMASYLVSPAVILNQQVRRPRIDVQTLLAAISAYLLVGMFFTFVYNLSGLISPVGIFGTVETNTLSAQLFFSFSSLTTTGYGNLVPVNSLGQTVAVTEAITGQLFLVVAVARVVTAWVPTPRKQV